MPVITLETPLPNRSRPRPPSLIVLHATAGATAASSIAHLQGVGLSYHIIIARDGKDAKNSALADGSEPKVFACVPLDRVAFHVGSTIPVPGAAGGINNNSVGISLANLQRTTTPEPYPPAQLQALEQAIADALASQPSIRLITTHAIVQPWNRADPRDIDVDAIAARHGLQVWRPTAEQVKAHKPTPA